MSIFGGLERRAAYEIDSRVVELEAAVAARGLANTLGGDLFLGPGIVPGAPTGLRVVPGSAELSHIQIEWNPSPIANLKFYEVQFAENNIFVNAAIQKITDTQASHQCGFGSTCYARVRAIALSDTLGDWSPTLNLTTGLAFYPDLNPGAATNPTVAIDDRRADGGGAGYLVDETVTLDAIANSLEAIRFGHAIVETVGGIILPAATSKVTYKGNEGDSFRLLLRRDEHIVQDTDVIELPSTVSSHKSAFFPTLTVPDVPPAGTWTYSVEIRCAGVAVEVFIQEIAVQLVELRR